MSLTQFISILKARWLILTGVILATVTATLIISMVVPKQYTAVSAVVVDVKSPDPIAGMVLPGLMSTSYMATQADVLKSERVAQTVISALKLDQNPQLKEQWRDATDGKGDFRAWLAETLQKSLDVRPERESNIINVSYVAVDPRFAAVMANAFVQAYIDTTIALRVEPARQYNAMFESQTKRLRENLEQTQAKLSKYQQENGIIATDERLDVENARLNDLSTQLVNLQTQSADSSSRQARASANSAESLSSPVVSALRADLARQQSRLQELTARFGEAHPAVQELKASIDELRTEIRAEISRVTDSVSITNSVNQSRAAQIQAALNAQREKILKLKAQRDESAVLLRDVENAQRAYDSIQARMFQTGLESQSSQTNVAVLRAASEPSKPSSPKVALYTALSLLLGTALAVGLVFALELLDRRLRCDDDIVKDLEVVLLPRLPVIEQSKSRGKKQALLEVNRRRIPELAGPIA